MELIGDFIPIEITGDEVEVITTPRVFPARILLDYPSLGLMRNDIIFFCILRATQPMQGFDIGQKILIRKNQVVAKK